MTVRVLQLISSNGFYGAESVVASLSSGLIALDCEITLCLFTMSRMPIGALKRFKNESGAAVVDLHCSGRFDAFALLRLIYLIRKSHVDVLHCHGYKADVFGLLAARIAGCKVVATCHNWTDRTAALRWSKSIDLRLLRLFSRVVAVSDPVTRILTEANVAQSKIRLVDNGIKIARYDRPRTQNDAPGTLVLGVLSRLSREKGIDVLIRALPAILAAHPALVCRIAGEGPERASILALAAELNVLHRLELLGFCSDTVDFLSHCSIVVLPSRTEGMPLALLESMASGIPIVASAVGSVPTVLLDGAAGLLVAPEDPTALANAVLRLLSDADLRKEIGSCASEQVRIRFDAKVMARNYLEIYRQLCATTLSAPTHPVV